VVDVAGGSDKYGGVRIVPFGKDKKEFWFHGNGQGDTSKLWLDLLECVKTRQKPKCSIDMAVRVTGAAIDGRYRHRENRVVHFDKALRASSEHFQT